MPASTFRSACRQSYQSTNDHFVNRHSNEDIETKSFKIKFKRAPNPSDIIWENRINTIKFGKQTRRFILFVAFFVILACFFYLNVNAAYMVAYFRYVQTPPGIDCSHMYGED